MKKNIKRGITALGLGAALIGIMGGQASAASLDGISATPVAHNQTLFYAKDVRIAVANANMATQGVNIQPQKFNTETQQWENMPWHSFIDVAPQSKEYVAFDGADFPINPEDYWASTTSDYRFEITSVYKTFDTEGFNTIGCDGAMYGMNWYGAAYQGIAYYPEVIAVTARNVDIHQAYWPNDVRPEKIEN